MREIIKPYVAPYREPVFPSDLAGSNEEEALERVLTQFDYLVSEKHGDSAFVTNTHIALRGRVPMGCTLINSGKILPLNKVTPDLDSAVVVTPVCERFKDGKSQVWLSDGTRCGGFYVDFMLTRFKGCELRREPADHPTPVAVTLDGQLVGVIMPMSYKPMPEIS